MIPPNRARGEIALPTGHLLRFSLDSLERLRDMAGDMSELFDLLVDGDLKTVRTALALTGNDIDDIDLSIPEIVAGIVDALHLANHGKTNSELHAENPAKKADSPKEDDARDQYARLREAAYSAGLLPTETDGLTPLEIATVVGERVRGEHETTALRAWLIGQLSMVGWHAPKQFPKSPAELLPKKSKGPAKGEDFTSPQQWAAVFSQALGKPVKVNKPTITTPTPDEIARYSRRP